LIRCQLNNTDEIERTLQILLPSLLILIDSTYYRKEPTMNNELISKQQLQDRYGVCKKTILKWIQMYELPMIEITQHRKYIRMSDVLKFESDRMNGSDVWLQHPSLWILTEQKVNQNR
jgi:hypothetical protein